MKPYLVLVCLIFLPFVVGAEDPPFSSTKVETEPFKEKESASLPLQTRIGQLLFLGFNGHSMTPTLRRMIRDLRPGGLILFHRNIRNPMQTVRLTTAIRREFREAGFPPPFLAVDQEGGRVSRLNFGYPMPSPFALGATHDQELIENFGEQTGQILRALGLNMNLAPVLDLGNAKRASFIDTRAFDVSPQGVAEAATSFIRGHENSRIISAVKHFPGHGGDIGDSHAAKASSPLTLPELLSRDLNPYLELNKQMLLPAVLIGHVAFPKIDATGVPATYSKKLLTEIGRKMFGPETLFITDDLNMAGGGLSAKRAATQALNAGADSLMITWGESSQIEARNSIVDALKNNTLTEARLDESVQRVLRLKSRFNLAEPFLPPEPSELYSVLRSDEMRGLIRDTMGLLFRASAKRISRDRLQKAVGETIRVLSSSPLFISELKGQALPIRTEVVRSVKDIGQGDFAGLGVVYVSGQNTLRDLESVSKQLRSQILIVNTHTTAAIRDRDSYLGVVDIHSPFARSGRWVGKLLARTYKQKQMGGLRE